MKGWTGFRGGLEEQIQKQSGWKRGLSPHLTHLGRLWFLAPRRLREPLEQHTGCAGGAPTGVRVGEGFVVRPADAQ